MKKKIFTILIVALIYLVPNYVYATSLSVSISCKDVNVNSTATCTVSATVTNPTSDSSGVTPGLADINADFAITSNGGTATISSFSNGSGWEGSVLISDGYFKLYGDAHSGTFTVGTFTIKGTKAGKVTLSLTNIYGGDNVTGDQIKASNKSASFNVVATASTTTTTTKTTTKKTAAATTTKTTTAKTAATTTKRTTTNSATTAANQNTATQRVTTTTVVRATMAATDLVLSSVQVDDFNVTYENGIYYATVNANTEKVTISATAPAGVTVIGSGQRTLAVGDNSVDLVLRDQGGQTVTYQLIITRPEGLVITDTKLTSLRVVGYEFAFNPNTLEYTVTVPSNINEVYVEAKSYSSDVIITGDGVQTLNKGKNDIYIRVSYGELANTEYKITIKRSYMSTIMWVIIGLLGAGLIGMAIYANINRKAAVSKAVAEKNKQIAQNNRAAISGTPQVQLNGESVVGTGKKTIAPTPVKPVTPVAPQPGSPVVQATPVSPIKTVTPVAQGAQNSQATPVVKTVQAKPTVVQANGAKPSDPKMIQTAPPAQVKVVKTTVVPVKPAPTQAVSPNPAPTPNVLPANDNKPVI